MCFNNKTSFEINYNHIKQIYPTIAYWIGFYPSIVLPQLNVAIYGLAKRYFPNYINIVEECFVKIRDLPIIDKIAELRYVHSMKLVRGITSSIKFEG